jgi:hypothetical protein
MHQLLPSGEKLTTFLKSPSQNISLKKAKILPIAANPIS